MRSHITVATLALAGFSTLLHAQAPATPKPSAPPSLAAAPASTPISPAKQTKIEEMLTLTRVEPSLVQMMQQMQGRIQQIAQQQTAAAPKTPDAQKLSDDYLAKMKTIADSNATWDHVKPSIIQAYGDSFTDAQLDSILAFYHTPAGQALLEKTPDVSQKTMQSIQKTVGDIQPLMVQATKDYTDKLKAVTPPTLNSPLADPPKSAAPPASTAPKK